jgi:hypothetical protein
MNASICGLRGFHASYSGICAQPLTKVVNDPGHHPGAGVRKGSEVGYVGNESVPFLLKHRD